MSFNPQVVVLGANGMLGAALSDYLVMKQFDVVRLTRSTFDVLLDSFSRIESFINNHNQLVVNCIVYDVRSANCQDVVQVNSLFPRRLAYLCAQQGAKLIHISSNAVFAGATGSYRENDVADPSDLYGISKLLGETRECMVLRTSIIGNERASSRYLLQWAISQKGKQVSGYTNHYWNGVTTLALSEAIGRIIADDLFCKGIFHLHSSEVISKYELLQMIDEIYHLGLDITAQKADSPDNKTLSSLYDLTGDLIKKNLCGQLRALHTVFIERSR